MSDLKMPSDVKKAPPEQVQPAVGAEAPPEPPSAKLIVRLFLIPLLIVALAVGIMFLIGMLAGGTPTVDEALERLRQPGGGRTADWLVGPGSKQRYMDAKILTDHMKQRMARGMPESERIVLAGELVDVLDNHTRTGEGEVRHFLLLALGRTWQMDPSQQAMDSPAAVESRRQVMDTLLRYAHDGELETRKAAVLAIAYWSGRNETRRAIPTLIDKVENRGEDLDVRLAAATVLGPVASEEDERVIDVLQQAMRDPDPRNVELVWGSALSLAQLNQPQVTGTILMLLDRDELSELEYYDRETDPRNPRLRRLSDQEQQRILINTMIGVRNMRVPEVQQRLEELANDDPSPRVRAAGKQILMGADAAAHW